METPRQLRNDRERGRNRAESKPPGQPLAELLQATSHVLGVGQDPLRVLERPLALRGQTDIPVAALDQRSAEILLKQPKRRRERRLGHMARLRRSAEVLFARKSNEILELPKHHHLSSRPRRGAEVGACQ